MMKRSIAYAQCRTDVKLAPCKARRLRILNQHSIWLSQLARVGV